MLPKDFPNQKQISCFLKLYTDMGVLPLTGGSGGIRAFMELYLGRTIECNSQEEAFKKLQSLHPYKWAQKNLTFQKVFKLLFKDIAEPEKRKKEIDLIAIFFEVYKWRGADQIEFDKDDQPVEYKKEIARRQKIVRSWKRRENEMIGLAVRLRQLTNNNPLAEHLDAFLKREKRKLLLAFFEGKHNAQFFQRQFVLSLIDGFKRHNFRLSRAALRELTQIPYDNISDDNVKDYLKNK